MQEPQIVVHEVGLDALIGRLDLLLVRLEALASSSSVKIGQNAKGEPAVEVKGYPHDIGSLEETRLAVIAAFQTTVAAVGA